MKNDALAIVCFEKVLIMKRKLVLNERTTLISLNAACINIGDLERALKYSKAAFDQDLKTFGGNHEQTLNTRSLFARVKELQCDYKEALLEYTDILSIKRTEKYSKESVAITLIDLGHVYLLMGTFDLSEKHLSDALNILL